MLNYQKILGSGDVGNLQSRRLQEERETIINHWEPYGVLDNLSGILKENVALLMENQATYMLTESTTSESSGSFETIVFPVIRRVFAKLLANEIITVFALNLPVGRAYYLNPQISQRNSDGSQTVMEGSFSNAANNWQLDAYGRKVTQTAGTQMETFSLYDAFYATNYGDYGTALFDRTTGKIFVQTPLVSGGTNWNVGVTTYLPVYITGFSLTNSGLIVGPIGIPMDTEEFLASLTITANNALVATGSTSVLNTIQPGGSIPYSIPAQKYGSPIVNAAGNLLIALDLSYPNPGFAGGSGINTDSYLAFSAVAGTFFTANYNCYSDLEEDAAMAEISFAFAYVTIDVGMPRKLRATFTPELAQDAMAFQNINVEAELTALLSETVASEIDRTILREIRNSASWMLRWNYNGLQFYSGITRKDYNQTLITVVNQISAAVQKSTLRGGANWIVVSPEIAAVFNDLEYFHVTDAQPEELKFSMGIEKIGSIQNRYTVFVDAYAPANTLLIGHKGDSIFNTGYIFCPYVPIMLLPKMLNPSDGKTSTIQLKGLFWRYDRAFRRGILRMGS